MDISKLLPGTISFHWDEGNIGKNWEKHGVHPSECEDVFFNRPLVAEDIQHSQIEFRYHAFGATDKGRLLLVVFTIREGKIRVISARDMHKKERKHYHEEIKKNPYI